MLGSVVNVDVDSLGCSACIKTCSKKTVDVW